MHLTEYVHVRNNNFISTRPTSPAVIHHRCERMPRKLCAPTYCTTTNPTTHIFIFYAFNTMSIYVQRSWVLWVHTTRRKKSTHASSGWTHFITYVNVVHNRTDTRSLLCTSRESTWMPGTMIAVWCDGRFFCVRCYEMLGGIKTSLLNSERGRW